MDEQSERRISSGVPGLDEVVGGGLLAGRLHVFKGSPGTGKTVLANQVCFTSAARGDRAVYMTLMTELHERLVDNLSSFVFFDRALVGRELHYLSLTGAFRQRGLEGLIGDVRSVVRQHQPVVVVLDGFLPLMPESLSALTLSMLLQDLEALTTLTGTTFLLTDSTPAGADTAADALVDGLVELEEVLFGMRARRALRVRKWRGARHLQGVHTFCIDQTGLRVSPQSPRAEGPPEPPAS